MADVPRELVRYVGQLLAAERRARGTRAGSRALTCFYQALLVLVWFRKGKDPTLLGAGFGVSRATAYRYLAEGITASQPRPKTYTPPCARWPPTVGPTSSWTANCSTVIGSPKPRSASKAR
ncbi:transposase family protein [Micromonospora polyrhachis]|uniref:transposase family protein n=1 Tax=Micromonospora polyrhachis TaxID=1282883 RepID=UPI0035E44B7A